MAGLVAAAVAVALYLPAVGFGFVFDDGSLIGPDGAPLPLGGVIPYRPLRYASYLVDWWLGGTPAVYHAHNVALHALVAFLVAAIARRLGASRAAALAGAVLVAAHPIAAESAAYVAGRRDLVCVALGLGSLLAHLHGRFAPALALLVLATAAKESALVFAAPLVAATLVRTDGNRVRATVAVAAASAAAALLALSYGAIGPWLPAADPGLGGRAALHYATGIAGLRALAPEYPALSHSATSVADAATGAAVLAAVLAAFLLCANRSTFARIDRATLVTLAWLASAFAAVSMWGALHEPGADRHAYLVLPAIGVAVSLAASRAFAAMPRGAAPVFAFVPVALVIAWAPLTRAQMEIWRSERSLWSAATAREDASARAYSNMARAIAADGDYALAREKLNVALARAQQPGPRAERDADFAALFLGRAAVRCAEGRGQLAARDLRRAGERGAEQRSVAGIAGDCGLVLNRRGVRKPNVLEAAGK